MLGAGLAVAGHDAGEFFDQLGDPEFGEGPGTLQEQHQAVVLEWAAHQAPGTARLLS